MARRKLDLSRGRGYGTMGKWGDFYIFSFSRNHEDGLVLARSVYLLEGSQG